MALTLTLTNISKRYNGKAALRDCSFAFDHSVIYALMGLNGSGKSTLLRICALLEPVDDGTLTYQAGKDLLPHDLALRRRMSLVLARVGVFNTTVMNNAAYGLRVRGFEKAVIARRVEAALETVRLAHKKQQNALTLSSGETQRLGLARAMAIEPEVLFLDEPTASIDEENTQIVEGIIRAMKQGGKTMVIMTTHDREQAARLADRVIEMRDGRIFIADGS